MADKKSTTPSLIGRRFTLLMATAALAVAVAGPARADGQLVPPPPYVGPFPQLYSLPVPGIQGPPSRAASRPQSSSRTRPAQGPSATLQRRRAGITRRCSLHSRTDTTGRCWADIRRRAVNEDHLRRGPGARALLHTGERTGAAAIGRRHAARERGKLPERLLPIRRVLRLGKSGQSAGGAETGGGELPLWLVPIRRSLREAQSLRGCARRRRSSAPELTSPQNEDAR